MYLSTTKAIGKPNTSEPKKAASKAAEKIAAKLVLGEFSDRGRKASGDLQGLPRGGSAITRAHCKASTYEGYEAIFENHLKEFDDRALDQIKPEDIQALISRKLVQDQKSKGTVRNIMAPLSEMFNHAIDEGVLSINPSARIGRFMKHTSGKANRMKIDPLHSSFRTVNPWHT
jgi:hypothetical protein